MTSALLALLLLAQVQAPVAAAPASATAEPDYCRAEMPRGTPCIWPGANGWLTDEEGRQTRPFAFLMTHRYREDYWENLSCNVNAMIAPWAKRCDPSMPSMFEAGSYVYVESQPVQCLPAAPLGR